MSDWEEVYAGTCPTNKADCLKTIPFSVNGSNIVLKWSSSYGRLYTLDHTTNLLVNFQPAASNIVATPTENCYTDAPANLESPHFYRIKVQ